MVERLEQAIPQILDHDPEWRKRRYDVAVWWCGYEQRSTWLVDHARPTDVAEWFRLEPKEDRDKYAAPSNLKHQLGSLACDQPVPRNWDGLFLRWWRSLVDQKYAKARRPLSIFCDYSSMPRALYGQLVLEATRQPHKFESLTLAYVPGKHGDGVDGSRRLDGLRSLIGTEGTPAQQQPPAAVVGLGYDGSLAQAAMDLFQFDHFSCFYAGPGTTTDAESRALQCNATLVQQCEVLKRVPATSVADAFDCVLSLCHWYLARRNVMLIPLGPKPHVLASILASAYDPRIALRWVLTKRVRAVDVTPTGKPAVVSRVTWKQVVPATGV
jgi:hypothetical protein